METREKEIVARAVEIVADAVLTAEATNGPLYEAIMSKVNDLRHRTPPSPQAGGVELYRKHWDDVHRAHYYKRATKAEAVIEAARKWVKSPFLDEARELSSALSALDKE
jgi:hypothetical protein